MTTRTKPNTVPLFAQYSLEELASRTGYSEMTLVNMKSQPAKITPRFRDVVSRILGRSEAELFDGVNEAGDSDYTAPANVETVR